MPATNHRLPQPRTTTSKACESECAASPRRIQNHCDTEEESDALRFPRRRTPLPPDREDHQPFIFPLNFPHEPRDDVGLENEALEPVTAVDVDASLSFPLVELVDGRERGCDDEDAGLSSPRRDPRRRRREGVDVPEVLRGRSARGGSINAESSDDMVLIAVMSACASRRVAESPWSQHTDVDHKLVLSVARSLSDRRSGSSSFGGTIGRREAAGEYMVASAHASKLGVASSMSSIGLSSIGMSWMAMFMIPSALAMSSELKDRISDDR